MGRYYMPEESNKHLGPVFHWLKTGERPRPHFPRAIQIQTISLCNAQCSFCGYKSTFTTQPQGVIDEALFKKIIDECSHHYIGRISPYLMNEPLLDKNLPEKIAYINRNKKLGTKTKINTNGYLLNENMSHGLIKAGLRHLWISIQGYSRQTYRKAMGLDDPQRVFDNIDRLIEIKEKLRSHVPKLTITTLNTKIVATELEYAKAYWKKKQINFRIHGLDNRAGEELRAIAPNKPHRRRSCDLFLKQAYILFNGDMLFCCHDWRRTVVVGNVKERSIKEIWNSSLYKKLIYQYNSGDFSNIAICRQCAGY
ncbi:MAG: radical SAM/SPASM domain-containing protein [bacterium]